MAVSGVAVSGVVVRIVAVSGVYCVSEWCGGACGGEYASVWCA